MTLRTKLCVLVILPLGAVFSVLATMQYSAMRDAAIAAAEEHALLLTQATAREIEAELAKAVHVAHAGAAALAEAHELKGDRVWPLLETLVDRVPLVEGASVAWAPGQGAAGGPAAPYVWRRHGTMHHQDLSVAYAEQGAAPYVDRGWYQAAADGTAGWTPPYEGPVFDGLLVSYSVPVTRGDAVIAVVSLDVPLVPLQERLSVGEFERASGYLVGPDDRFISNPDPAKIMEDVTAAGGPSLLAAASPGTLERVPDWPNGSPHIVAFEPIPTADWVFAAALTEDEILGPVYRQLWWNVVVIVLGGGLMAAIVLATGLRLTGDVRRLAAAVGRVTGGDLGATVDEIRRRDELGKLAGDFNIMTRQLEATVERAATEKAAFAAVEQELDVAREIQAEMLPHEYPMLPDHPEVDLHAVNEPARHVAGDFYDYWVRDGVLNFVLADVAGSGVPAALVMVRAMTLLRQFDEAEKPLVDVVSQVNAELCGDNERQVFVTGVVVRYAIGCGTYELVSAGHLPAFVCRNGTVESEGDSTGPLLGIVPDGAWSMRSGTLQPGDWLAIYTDGITEARDAADQMLGCDGLLEALQRATDCPARELCIRGIGRAESWHGGRVDDDLSILVLRRTP
ncbi:MAG: SpoIIE family protein phosphatase [Phycisphaerales bacterium]|jgi:sigma-B regulation protein RsbU (phosphoserine phosphatase)|nr:SpoIIE family protein phosphatase [Phycisphaerales bacterium]